MTKKNHIIFFSGGKSSFTVAHLVKERYPDDNILLYFTDTLWEDEDLYRFIYEASDKLQLPMLYHCLGLNPVQLMHKQAVVFNSRIGDCSKVLKMGVAADWLKRNIDPPTVKWHNKEYLKEPVEPAEGDFKERTTLYFGIGWEEAHREGAIKTNWQPFGVEMPLMEEIIDNNEVLEIYDIKQPRLYDIHFSHNNCKGRCVKAGQGHYINLLQQLPTLFQETMAFEHHMSRYVSEYHYLKNQKYVPEHERFDDDTLEILLKELNDAYEDYFWERAEKPKPYVPSYVTATPYETNLLLVDYSFRREKKKRKGMFNGHRWKRESGRKTYYKLLEEAGNKQPKKKWFIKAQDGLKLIETRHCKPRDYSYMKRSKGGVSKPYPLRNLYWDAVSEGLHIKKSNVIVQKQESNQLDLFDVGGCGCDFSQTDASACDLMSMLEGKEPTHENSPSL